MTITVSQQTHISDILSATADALDQLTCFRVSPPDLHRALTQAHPGPLVGEGAVAAYHQRQAAFEALAAYMADLSGGRWLHGWTGPQPRTDVVDQVRAAARCAEIRAARAAEDANFRPCFEHGYVDCGCNDAETPAAVVR